MPGTWASIIRARFCPSSRKKVWESSKVPSLSKITAWIFGNSISEQRMVTNASSSNSSRIKKEGISLLILQLYNFPGATLHRFFILRLLRPFPLLPVQEVFQILQVQDFALQLEP